MARPRLPERLVVLLNRSQLETVAALCAQEADGLEEMEDAAKEGFRRRVMHLRGIVEDVERALRRSAEG